MGTVKKTVTLRIYPSRKQKVFLWNIFETQRALYNAMLEQRIWAYRNGVSLNYYDQAAELKTLKHEVSEYKYINAQSMQNLAKRLDRAFGSFYSRVKQKKTPGFPRFKSKNSFLGWGYNSHGDGWKIMKLNFGRDGNRTGKIRISGVGIVQVRGKIRDNGKPKIAEITRRNGKWYISITFEMDPVRHHGKGMVTYDLGSKEFATLAKADDKNKVSLAHKSKLSELIILQKSLKKDQKKIAKKKRGSKRQKHLKSVLRNKHKKIADKRKDILHKASHELVSNAEIIGTEILSIKNLTRSSRGTKEKPGKKVKQKSGLNRNLLNHSLSAFNNMIRYKAKEAGAIFELLNTRKLKPTQRCCNPKCGEIVKKKLSDRVHKCSHCGIELDRDVNAALVMLVELAKIYDRGPVVRGVERLLSTMKRETPSISI